MTLTKAVVGGDGLATERLCDDTGNLVQASANLETAVTGSNVDTRTWTSLAYTIVNNDAANTAQWVVYGANASTFADEVAVQALADVTPEAPASYSTTQSVFAYYRVKIHSKVDGAHASCTVRGVQKP